MADPTWHFEANDVFYSDGKSLKRWSSKNYETPDFIQNVSSKRPVYRENFLNGNSVLEFRSNYNQHMFTEELGDDKFNFEDSLTTIIVCKVNKDQDDHVIQSWGYLNSDDFMWEHLSDSKKFLTKRKTEFGNSNFSFVSVQDKSKWKIHISRHTKNSIQHIVNGVKGFKKQGKYIDFYDHIRTYLGSRIGSESESLDGYIAEFMAFNKTLSEEELENFQKMLSTKYNIKVKSIL